MLVFFLYIYIIIYSACSITVSNTTCTVDILHNYLSSKYSYIFKNRFVDLTVSYFFFLCSLSRDRLSVNFLKSLQYLFISISLLTGQFSDRSTAALSMSRSCSTSSQLNNIWSIVCSPLLQEHIGLSLILNLYKYALIFPCPVYHRCKIWSHINF